MSNNKATKIIPVTVRKILEINNTKNIFEQYIIILEYNFIYNI